MPISLGTQIVRLLDLTRTGRDTNENKPNSDFSKTKLIKTLSF